jgi:hypothetical protein
VWHFPFLADNAAGGRNGKTDATGCRRAEFLPDADQGCYAYDFGDASGFTPLMKMYTLGHDFMPPGIHAGGLRYHGDSPLVSQLYHEGLIEAVAVAQLATFEAGVMFARAEGIIPAPESNHAIRAAIDERCAAGRLAKRGRSSSISPGTVTSTWLPTTAISPVNSRISSTRPKPFGLRWNICRRSDDCQRCVSPFSFCSWPTCFAWSGHGATLARRPIPTRGEPSSNCFPTRCWSFRAASRRRQQQDRKAKKPADRKGAEACQSWSDLASADADQVERLLANNLPPSR